MNDLNNYKNVEPLALMEQMEIMQDELEQKDGQIQMLQKQLEQLPTLSEWQKVQELLQEQTTQLQEQSSTIRQQAEQIETLNENDSLQKENQQLKKENADLAAKVKTAESEKASALAQAEYAKKHVRTEKVKVPTYYSKCIVCDKESLQEEIEVQKKKQENLRYYLIAFEVLVGIVILFTAFKEKVFWQDFKNFFIVLWDILEVNGTALYKGYSTLSGLAVAGIDNATLQCTLYWILLLLLFMVNFAGIYFLLRWIWKSWQEKVMAAVNPFTISLSVLLLLVVVYLGEFVKLLLPMNLWGLWIIGTIVIIGIAIYVMDCISYRR